MRLALAALLLAYGALAVGYALATPKWNNPDEPAHYNYLRAVATTGQLPVLEPGDWDSDHLERLKAARFPPHLSVDMVRYESHQPPLYYLLASPIFIASAPLGLDGQVIALRSFSILLGALALMAIYRASRILFPQDPVLWLAAPGLAAFIPMNTAATAAINNDALAEVAASGLLVLLFPGLVQGFSLSRALLVGAAMGAALLTKVTAYPIVALGLAAMIAVGPAPELRGKGRWGSRVAPASAAAAVALGISAWWFLRNVAVYGWPDLLGSRRHDLVVVGQPRLETLDWGALQHFSTTLFQSFWGQLGWMGILLDQTLYAAFAVLTVVALVGSCLYVVRLARTRALDSVEGRAAPLWLGALLAALAGVAYYNLTFVQPQGRYLFAAILPLGLALALGLREVARVAAQGPTLGRWVALCVLLLASILLLRQGLYHLLDLPAGGLFRAVAISGATSAGFTAAFALRPPKNPEWILALLPVAALAVADLAALLRFVAPYFRQS